MVSEVEAEACELVRLCRERTAVLRVLGGVGVAIRCPSVGREAALRRSFSDVDFATTRRSVRAVCKVFEERGYVPDKRFNAAHGARRLIFDSPEGQHVDVFVDRFSMCHDLHLGRRLELESVTLTLADLLLTKAQVARLNQKDVTDCVALLGDHGLTDTDDGINISYISDLLARDWGWWRTVTENVTRVAQTADEMELPVGLRERVQKGAAALLSSVERRPKSVQWRLRARVGDRISWREDPEDLRQ